MISHVIKRADSKDYRQIFLSEAPLIDLRAPCEFNKGSFPNAISLPLMSDWERQKVGTCYKRDGQEEAIKLGHRLVSGQIKDERMERWTEFANDHPDNGYLFCFRGGLRSRTVQSWLSEVNIHYPLILGGYKALRRYLIDNSERLTEKLPFYVIAGLTGSAKTPLLLQQKNTIDLEGLANHRGSSFGRQLTPQPSQIDFENQLAIALLRLEQQNATHLLLEDEARLIGARSTPPIFFNKMSQAPLILLLESFEFRLEHIHQEYVKTMYAHFCEAQANEPLTEFGNYLLSSIDKIRKRLGNEAHGSLRQKILRALKQQKASGCTQLHYDWINQLLTDYYDPMYHFQLKKKQHRIVFQGVRQEVSQFIADLS